MGQMIAALMQASCLAMWVYGCVSESESGSAAAQVLVSAVTLAAFGVTGAMLGGANVFKGGARVVIGGLAAMGITYGFGRIFTGSTGGL